jgi:NAD(P)-dependent dehydrogenase (short-subunit alcohol dehydrogenase family)
MLKENSLSCKVVVVTGGGTGLGKAMSKAFLELGANVIISSRSQDVIEKTAMELSKSTNGKCFAIPCDVREPLQIKQLREKCIEMFGRVDILVNNAAGNFISPTERLSSRAFGVIIDIVLKGTVNCTLEFGKHWIDTKQTKAKVLNIVTTYAYTGSAYVVPSATAKAGVLALTRSLAIEWAKYNIWFNAIAPGPFPTKGAWERLLPGDMASKFDLGARNPLKRVGEHQELANLATYLVSDYSDYINGEVVTIDGGEWLQGAGEFNLLNEVTSEEWDTIEKMVKNVKGS